MPVGTREVAITGHSCHLSSHKQFTSQHGVSHRWAASCALTTNWPHPSLPAVLSRSSQGHPDSVFAASPSLSPSSPTPKT